MNTECKKHRQADGQILFSWCKYYPQLAGEKDKLNKANVPEDAFYHVFEMNVDGSGVRQLTRGNWDVTAFHGVDEAEGRIFFTAASESPTTRSVYSAPLEGGDMTRLAGGRGTHSARFSPDFVLFTDTYSSIGTPPVTRLRRVADGSEVRVLADNAELVETLEGLDLREPEFFTVQAGDGSALNTMDQAQAKGMPADVCAQKMRKAIDAGKREVYIGGKETIGVWIKRFFPGIFAKKLPSIKVR